MSALACGLIHQLSHRHFHKRAPLQFVIIMLIRRTEIGFLFDFGPFRRDESDSAVLQAARLKPKNTIDGG